VSEELPEDPFALDAETGTIVLAVGKKRSGKSVFARQLYKAWPYDKLVIDPTGDADPGEDAERLRPEEITNRFPVRHELNGPAKPRNLHYRADPGSPTYRQDIDRVIGMALRPRDRKTLLWVDEWGEVSQVNRTQPNARRLMMQSRHYGPVSAILCCPRPKHIDRLSISQADGIAIYAVPDFEDRRTLAANMGYDPKEFEAEYADNRARGTHSYLFWHAPSETLFNCPPLPYP
jgi:hypothetical protein